MVPFASTLSTGAPPLRHLEYKTTIVITPAISLMNDQVTQINDKLKRCGSDLSELGLSPGADFATFLGMGQEDKGVADAVKRGEYRLVFVTEQLLFGRDEEMWKHSLKSLYQQGKLMMIAVDEAHCVVQYPDSGTFRMHYRDIGKLRTALPSVPMMALSAVPTKDMWVRIEKSLGMRDPVRTIGSVFR